MVRSGKDWATAGPANARHCEQELRQPGVSCIPPEAIAGSAWRACSRIALCYHTMRQPTSSLQEIASAAMPKISTNDIAADDIGGQLPAARLADRPPAPGGDRSAARACAGAVARRPVPCSSRLRTTPRCWRSATRSAPASMSSPMARCGAKATPTALRPRSTAWTATIRRRSPRARRARFRSCRGWSARSGAGSRCRSGTWCSCAPTPTGRSRSRFPAPSP